MLRWAIMLGGVFLAGCTGSIRETTTPRTAEEQLLLSTAAERAAEKMDLSSLKDRRVYVDVTRLDTVDRGYVMSLFFNALGRAGARMVQGRENADAVIEFRSAALGNTDMHWWIPIPTPLAQIYVPEGVDPESIPTWIEIGYTLHEGWAKFAFFVYDAKTLAYIHGDKEAWGYAYKGFFDDIYPTTLEDSAKRLVQ